MSQYDRRGAHGQLLRLLAPEGWKRKAQGGGGILVPSDKGEPIPVPSPILPEYLGLDELAGNRPHGETIIHKSFEWNQWTEAAKGRNKKIIHRSEWAGGTFEDALAMAEGDGYQAAVSEAEDLIAHINMDMENRSTPGFVSNYQVAGGEIDMGRYLAGDPECMMESLPIPVMRTGRVLKLMVPICYSSMVHEDTVRRRGAAVMALVDCFQRSQHVVEIWGVLAIHSTNGKPGDRNKRLVYSVKVQDADQPMNMGRVMFALAHPTMLRQLGFGVEDQEDAKTREIFGIGRAYGTFPYSIEVSDADINAENAIVLPELKYSDSWDRASAVEWVQTQLERIEAMSS